MTYLKEIDVKTILITGSAGFIGANLVKRLLITDSPVQIVGLDSVNDYYDVRIKKYRLESLKQVAVAHPDSSYIFVKGNIADKALIGRLFAEYSFDVVINLAAQAGVRYSISNPDAYIESNLIGFYNILEACRHSYNNDKEGVQHLVYASSSSVYGSNKKVPYNTDDKVDNPVSLYAATKKSNELMAHAYSKLYNIPSTGLRFFTVYGPAGRPDMAYFGFTNKLIRGEKIQIFNYGNCKRDFTYIDDIVEGTIQVLEHTPIASECANGVPYQIYNIGCSNPVKLMDFINEIEHTIGKKAQKIYLPMQPGDVYQTYADTTKLEQEIKYKPKVNLHEGIRNFINWYKSDSNPLK